MDCEYTLLATSSKGDALDFLNFDVSAPTEAETPLSELIRHWMNKMARAGNSCSTGTAPWLVTRPHMVADRHGSSPSWRSLYLGIRACSDYARSDRDGTRQVYRVETVERKWLRLNARQIEKYARFITADAEIQTRLTTAEKAYASSQAQHTGRHLHYSVLQSLPPAQAHLDDQPIFVPPMVTQPNKSHAVFAYTLKECPLVRLPDGATLTLEKDRLTLVPFYVVEHLVERGDAELI
ncbi:hypothetical protein EDD85DRAFT_792710 [Armillaria nabsnona]|nr:hypothetical protein EDD85DRAFT_792710 [Armillaria nabsnona]